MAIIEVGLLSCFSLAPDGIQTNTYLKNVETKPELVILYLDSVTTEEMCLQVPLVMYCKVAQGQKASVVIYDYYEPRRKTVKMYYSEWRSSMSTCSFCGEDCSECRQNDYSVFSTSSHSSQQFLPTTLLFALLVLLRIMI
uniref:CD109 antigen-like n=1 Tax=Monopterus albus TaxID=43700 RepID=UPI0009B38AC1|nr:CD109 antigen-like [Monopterus albus]